MKTTLLMIPAIAVFAGSIAVGQRENPAQPREAFDVVSIRRNTSAAGAGPRGQAGGGVGTRNDPCTTGADPRIDPTRFDTTNTTVIQLIGWAYGIDCNTFRGLDLVSGGPDWIKSEGYNVQATRPEGPSDYAIRREGTIGSFVVNTPGPKTRGMVNVPKFRPRSRRVPDDYEMCSDRCRYAVVSIGNAPFAQRNKSIAASVRTHSQLSF